jgi:cytochrome c oxidase assembly protein subunit 20
MEDISKIGETPCARSSLLYGIGGGSALGAVRYIGSRSESIHSYRSTMRRVLMIGPKAGANWAVLGFVVIAITQWSVLSPCAVQIPREKGIDP